MAIAAPAIEATPKTAATLPGPVLVSGCEPDSGVVAVLPVGEELPLFDGLLELLPDCAEEPFEALCPDEFDCDFDEPEFDLDELEEPDDSDDFGLLDCD